MSNAQLSDRQKNDFFCGAKIKFYDRDFRPKSVPNSPSVQRAFSNLRHQLTSAWSSHSSKKKAADQSQLSAEDKKKWPSAHDCSGKSLGQGQGRGRGRSQGQCQQVSK